MVSEPQHLSMDSNPSIPSSSALSDSTSNSLISSATDPVVSLTIPISTKLHQNNFLTWKSQILPIVNGHNLARFLTSMPPNPTTLTSNAQITLNPEYLPWNRQDQLLLGWLRSSLTELIQAQLVSCTTSAALWMTLENLFASTSRARLLDLKRQIQTANKGSSSCTEYLQSIRRVADELAFIGAPISDDDLVLAALNGLGSEFNSFVAAIIATSRREPLSFSDLHGLLLSHEALIQHQLSTISSPASSFPSAFAAFPQTGRFRPGNPHAKNRSHTGMPPPNSLMGPRPPFPRSNNSSAGPRPFPPRSASHPRSATGSHFNTPCQICKKTGHNAKHCYWRYETDPNYMQQSNSTARSDSGLGPGSTGSAPSAPHAYVVQPSNLTTTSDWILDSGATHHVTNDINNLSTFFNDNGSDNV